MVSISTIHSFIKNVAEKGTAFFLSPLRQRLCYLVSSPDNVPSSYMLSAQLPYLVITEDNDLCYEGITYEAGQEVFLIRVALNCGICM